MRFRRRHRQSAAYRHEPAQSRLRLLQPFAGTAIVAAVLVLTANWLLSTFEFGGAIRSAGALVYMESGNPNVTVSIDESEATRAEDGLRLYAGDALMTGGSNVSLVFFDGTVIRLDQESRLEISESKQGENNSEIRLTLSQGSAWLKTPTMSSFSGSIERIVGTSQYESVFLSDTEAYIGQSTLSIFEDDGPGATVTVTGHDEEIVIGEGQSLNIAAAAGGDPYDMRGPLVMSEEMQAFVDESRQIAAGLTADIAPPVQGSGAVSQILTIETPLAQSVVSGSTIIVSGTYDPNSVIQVRVNGYEAALDNGEYTVELSLPDDDEIVITVAAIGDEGSVITEERRTVVRNVVAPQAPAFTSPAETGQTYRTAETRLEIVGTAPADAVGIIVNDYRLQFFEPGDTEWRYLANVDLGNLSLGENAFRAVAVYEGGTQSEAAELTIIIGDGEAGVIDEGNGGDEGEDEPAAPTDLPDNEPTNPGSLRITSPAAGTSFTTSENDLLIEGAPPAGAASIWVNDYQLRLFESGDVIWNYIANTELGTLKPGANEYEIVARDADFTIIDRVVYTITYTPAE